jgi:hypothetical protein
MGLAVAKTVWTCSWCRARARGRGRLPRRSWPLSRQCHRPGQREYLIIQPLAPAAAEPLITRAAEAVKILDDLRLVIRLV